MRRDANPPLKTACSCIGEKMEKFDVDRERGGEREREKEVTAAHEISIGLLESRE